MTLEEEWRPVVGWEGLYEVSNEGRVRSLDRVVPHATSGHLTLRGKILAPFRKPDMYWMVALTFGGKKRYATVHRLVAEAFIPNPDAFPVVRHADDNRDDNRVSNLAWGTYADNGNDAVRNGRNFWRNKTHCVNGHEFTEENTLYDSEGRRQCRICTNKRGKESRERLWAKGLAPDDPRHGTVNGYVTYKCRCESCGEAKRVYYRELDARKKMEMAA